LAVAGENPIACLLTGRGGPALQLKRTQLCCIVDRSPDDVQETPATERRDRAPAALPEAIVIRLDDIRALAEYLDECQRNGKAAELNSKQARLLSLVMAAGTASRALIPNAAKGTGLRAVSQTDPSARALNDNPWFPSPLSRA
jgi:hypothetical protein